MTILSSFNEVYYPIAIIILLVVVITFRKTLLPKGEIQKQLFIWGNLACVILFVLWFCIGAVTNQYNLPWWAFHTLTGHHIYDILGFCILFSFIWIKKGYRPVWAMVICVFFIGINEWAWWVTYYIYHYILNNTNFYLPVGITSKYLAIQAFENLTIFNFTGIAYLIIIAVFFYRIRFKLYQSKVFKFKFPLFLLGYFSMIFLIYYYWISIGFPITVDYSGNTIYYLTYSVNMIENLHWIIPTIYFILFFDYIFGQNPNLKGMPPSFFKSFFKGNENDNPIKEVT